VKQVNHHPSGYVACKDMEKNTIGEPSAERHPHFKKKKMKGNLVKQEEAWSQK